MSLNALQLLGFISTNFNNRLMTISWVETDAVGSKIMGIKAASVLRNFNDSFTFWFIALFFILELFSYWVPNDFDIFSIIDRNGPPPLFKVEFLPSKPLVLFVYRSNDEVVDEFEECDCCRLCWSKYDEFGMNLSEWLLDIEVPSIIASLIFLSSLKLPTKLSRSEGLTNIWLSIGHSHRGLDFFFHNGMQIDCRPAVSQFVDVVGGWTEKDTYGGQFQLRISWWKINFWMLPPLFFWGCWWFWRILYLNGDFWIIFGPN